MKNKAAQELGKKGGQMTAKKHGKKFYQAIGRKAAEVRWGKKKTKSLAI
jgi:general stress protein YciG